MSWTDPSSPWARAQRRRVRLMGCVALAQVAMLAIVLIGTWRLWALGGSVPGVGAFAGELRTRFIAITGLGVGLLFLIALWSVLLAGNQRRILRRVPAEGGNVCRRCLRAATIEDGRARCPRHGDLGTAEEVRIAWEQYGLGALRTEDLPPRERARLRRWKWIGLLGGGAILIASISVAASSAGLAGAITAVRPAIVVAGVLLVVAGTRRRAGRNVHCAACGYEQAEIAGPACPECGGDWRAPGGVVRGLSVERRTPLVVAGLVIAFLGIALMIAPGLDMWLRGGAPAPVRAPADRGAGGSTSAGAADQDGAEGS